jgi:recombination protein RecA
MVKATEETKEQKLNSLISKIDTNFGKGSIMRLGDKSNMEIERFSTGALNLDIALGGGLPRGRIIELWGAESTGKSSLTLHAIAEVQKAGGMAAVVDTEHSLDPIYASALGVNTDELLVSQPSTAEEALEVVDQLISSGIIQLVVIDSVAALVPRAELEGEIGDAHMALQARLMSQTLRKITGKANETSTTVFFTNQTRQKIGVTYGSTEALPGGNALKFYASIRMKISRIQTLKKGTDEYGIRSKVRVMKNKTAVPFKEVEFDILFGQGISTLGCLVDMAEEQGVLTRKAAWYSYESTSVACGRDKTIEWLRENPEIAAAIEAQIKSAAIIKKDEPVVVEEEVA